MKIKNLLFFFLIGLLFFSFTIQNTDNNKIEEKNDNHSEEDNTIEETEPETSATEQYEPNDVWDSAPELKAGFYEDLTLQNSIDDIDC